MTVGDLNGDGKPEIVVVNVADGNFSVYGNNSTIGNLAFATRMPLVPASGGGVPYAAVIADIDGDGMADIATADAGAAPLPFSVTPERRAAPSHLPLRLNSV